MFKVFGDFSEGYIPRWSTFKIQNVSFINKNLSLNGMFNQERKRKLEETQGVCDNCYAAGFYVAGFFDDFLSVEPDTAYAVFNVLEELSQPTDYCFMGIISPLKTIPPSDLKMLYHLAIVIRASPIKTFHRNGHKGILEEKDWSDQVIQGILQSGSRVEYRKIPQGEEMEQFRKRYG